MSGCLPVLLLLGGRPAGCCLLFPAGVSERRFMLSPARPPRPTNGKNSSPKIKPCEPLRVTAEKEAARRGHGTLGFTTSGL
ncbi:hypothetical protein CesoFtcFv8_006952 [Champsocephalus esox]|uniref:Secreted protein n=1 Tax=Champsocephalus esox TaxID=159716 RepID=A0AAN8CDB6_9TELE|nr:hypothetical protein CesoFtcFv8_006952 [Champsocephalus esox]